VEGIRGRRAFESKRQNDGLNKAEQLAEEHGISPKPRAGEDYFRPAMQEYL